MPSGKAMRLGDVLTIRGGTTVEVFNTDAEGRLVMADALVLATELDPKPDAIVTIATLTGAAMRTFGTALAADARQRPEPRLPDRGGRRADRRTGLGAAVGQALSTQARLGDRGHQEPWRRERRHHHGLGPSSKSSPADIPFGHLDICGPMMTDTDDSLAVFDR